MSDTNMVETSAQVASEVSAYIAEFFLLGACADFTAQTSLIESGIIDSTGASELVAFLETRYGIEVADHELTADNLDSVDKIAAFISRKLGAPLGATA